MRSKMSKLFRILFVCLILVALIVPVAFNATPAMATGPVVIDKQVTASADDCTVRWTGSAWDLYSLSSTTQTMGYISASALEYGGGLRFLGITIPSGAIITSSYISEKSSAIFVSNTVNSYITGNLESNPATFSTLADYQSRRGTVVGGADDTKITTAQVAWDNIPAWTSGNWYNSPDISTIIQELVNAHAPTNEAIVLFWDDHNDRSTHTSSAFRAGYSYDYSGNISGAKLHIEYVLAPAITAVAASNITTTTARLNSQITDDGGATGACTVKFGYDTSPHVGNFAAYPTQTSVTIPTSVYSTNDFPYLDVTGLTETTPYYYSVQVTNAHSTVTSTNEITFTTDTTVVNPSGVQASPLSTSISLSWSKGSGASKTLIRVSPSAFPTTTSGVGGTSIYLDTGVTYTHAGLTAGTTYYYSFWGEDSTVYSASYVSIAMTTSATDSVSSGLPTITNPNNFDITTPNETVLQNLGPFYDLINSFIDSWGMGRGNAWAGIVAFIIVILSLIVYIKSGSISGALVVTVVCMVIGYFIGLVSGWWILFGILGMLGSFALPKREA